MCWKIWILSKSFGKTIFITTFDKKLHVLLSDLFEKTLLQNVTKFVTKYDRHLQSETKFISKWGVTADKSSGFLMFSGDVERDQWHEMI